MSEDWIGDGGLDWCWRFGLRVLLSNLCFQKVYGSVCVFKVVYCILKFKIFSFFMKKTHCHDTISTQQITDNY